MKFLFIVIVLNVFLLSGAQAGFPATEADLPYYRENKRNCQTAMWLVNKQPLKLEVRRKSDNWLRIDNNWLLPDESKWSSGCLESDSKEKEDIVFIEAIRKYRKDIEQGKRRYWLMSQIESDESSLKARERWLADLIRESESGSKILAKLSSCKTYNDYEGQGISGLTGNKENKELFYLGLCLKYQDHEFTQKSANELSFLIYGLSMNGGSKLSINFRKNNKGIWTPESYKHYYAGRGYMVNKVWKEAMLEVSVSASLAYSQTLRSARKSQKKIDEYTKEITALKKALSDNKQELDMLVSSVKF